MLVSRLTYRPWRGIRRSHFMRVWSITREGIRLGWKIKFLRRFIFIAFLPFLYYALIFFLTGQMARGDFLFIEITGPLFLALRELAQDPDKFYSGIWAMLFYFYFHYTQVACVMIIIATVGPGLISRDIQSNALFIYFSKPLSRWDYVFGKFGVILFYTFLVTLLPGTLLYIISILISPSLEIILHTWQIPLHVLLASLIIAIPSGLMMLALSSLLKQSQILTFLWIIIWLGTWAISEIITVATVEVEPRAWPGLISISGNFSCVLYQIFGVKQRLGTLALSGDLRDFLDRISFQQSWMASLFILATLSLISLFILAARVKAREIT